MQVVEEEEGMVVAEDVTQAVLLLPLQMDVKRRLLCPLPRFHKLHKLLNLNPRLCLFLQNPHCFRWVVLLL